MTVMTLMTVICEGFLKAVSLYLVGSLISSIKPDKPDTGPRKPHSYEVYETMTDVGFSR
jgi:hypothetical protein